MQHTFEHTCAMLVLKYLDFHTHDPGTPETRNDLERLTTLGTMLSCIVYGAHVAFYFVAMKYMFCTSSPSVTPQNRLWLALSTLLLLNGAASLALQIHWSRNVERILQGPDSAFNIARVALFMTINWISDSVLLFRFFAITGRRLTMLILPSIMIISSIAVSSTCIQDIAAAYTSSWSDTSSAPIIAYLSISCGLNVYLTAHIVWHMVQFARKLGTSPTICYSVLSLFVRGALIYLVPTFVFIVLCAQRNLGQNLLFPIVCQLQPLSPLLVIMGVAQSRILNGDSAVITANDILSAPAHRRPRLSVKLDFRPPHTFDIEAGEKCPETPMAPTTPRLPKPLPFVRVKSDPPSAIDMLDSEKMDELWKSQDAERAPWLVSPSSSSSSYLPAYTTGQENLGIDEHRIGDARLEDGETPSDCNHPQEPIP